MRLISEESSSASALLPINSILNGGNKYEEKTTHGDHTCCSDSNGTGYCICRREYRGSNGSCYGGSQTEAATEAAEGETEVASEAAEGETEAAAEAADGDVAPIEGADVASRSSDAAPAWQEYNNLIQQIKTTTDLDEREAMMHQAEDMLRASRDVPLYYYNDIYLQKENVTGIYSNNYGFKYFMFADAGDSTTLRLNLQVSRTSLITGVKYNG